MSREHQARPRSRLEALPAELIQEIFLRCLEFNLPRASAHLAWALSSPVIYTWLVRLAFAKAEGMGDSFLPQHFIPPHDAVGYVGVEEMKELRTRILECRWCTLPLIRSCQLAFLNHVVTHKRYGFEIFSDDRDLADFAMWFNNLDICDTAPNGRRGDGDLILRANRPGHKFSGSNRGSTYDYNIVLWFNLGIIEVLPAASKNPSGKIYFELPCCEDAYLPEKLLYPPWTEEKLEFLQLLSTRAFLDRDTTFYRATRTLRNLIRERDFATFARLLELHVRIECYAFPVLWPCSNLVFRAALKHAGEENDPFIRLLVEERWGQLGSDDYLLKEKLLKKYRQAA
ncbi:hypothetical protein BDV18DRAFT_107290 [Aspergillus unguis]